MTGLSLKHGSVSRVTETGNTPRSGAAIWVVLNLASGGQGLNGRVRLGFGLCDLIAMLFFQIIKLINKYICIHWFNHLCNILTDKRNNKTRIFVRIWRHKIPFDEQQSSSFFVRLMTFLPSIYLRKRRYLCMNQFVLWNITNF